VSVTDPVIVVGAGIAGVACARELQAAGVPVRVLDRGRRIGGRMARWTRDGRAVDVGAAYFTVTADPFRDVVDGWAARGLAHPWTDTFHVAAGLNVTGTTSGPVRWSSEHGLRSLVEDLAAGLDIEHPVDVEQVGLTAGAGAGAGLEVDGRPAAAVVLAVPLPQATDLLAPTLLPPELAPPGAADAVDGWEPAMVVAAAWERRTWLPVDAVFVNDDPVLALVVDDGRRRGDHAPVLVARTTPALAAAHLDAPADTVPLVLDAVHRLLGIRGAPRWAEAKRWGLATPLAPHGRPYLLSHELVGFCGDAWGDRPRIEAAFLSGQAVGQALVAALVR
jgi:predicted NAD/FAD-dependent oxidoreductase